MHIAIWLFAISRNNVLQYYYRRNTKDFEILYNLNFFFISLLRNLFLFCKSILLKKKEVWLVLTYLSS